jgi:hypothetical protein
MAIAFSRVRLWLYIKKYLTDDRDRSLDLVELRTAKPLTVIRAPRRTVGACSAERPVAPFPRRARPARARDGQPAIHPGDHENAGSFTAISGWGQVSIGVTALTAAVIASRQTTEAAWLATWIVEAVVALAVGSIWIVRKARRTGLAFNSAAGSARR